MTPDEHITCRYCGGPPNGKGRVVLTKVGGWAHWACWWLLAPEADVVEETAS